MQPIRFDFSVQEAFERIVRGLASQGWKPSLKPRGKDSFVNACAYRGEDGRKCAVGWLIPDDVASEWDSKPKPALRSRIEAGDVEPADDRLIEFLLTAQRAHDDFSEGPADLRCRFISIGDDWKLVWPSDVPTSGQIQA